MGLPDSLETLQSKYDIDEALYVDDLNKRLAESNVVYTIPIAKTDLLDTERVKLAGDEDKKKLYAAFCEARAIKADWEVDIIRQSNKISSDAHAKVCIKLIFLLYIILTDEMVGYGSMPP